MGIYGIIFELLRFYLNHLTIEETVGINKSSFEIELTGSTTEKRYLKKDLNF